MSQKLSNKPLCKEVIYCHNIGIPVIQSAYLNAEKDTHTHTCVETFGN